MAYDYKDPRGIDVQRYREERHAREEAKARRARSRVRAVFVRALEIVTIALSYFQSSYIVRFLTAKVSMDVLVEVSARFGANAGHALSSVMAAIVAEPRLVAVVVAAVLLFMELIGFIGRTVSGSRRRRRAALRLEAVRANDSRRRDR